MIGVTRRICRIKRPVPQEFSSDCLCGYMASDNIVSVNTPSSGRCGHIHVLCSSCAVPHRTYTKQQKIQHRPASAEVMTLQQELDFRGFHATHR